MAVQRAPKVRFTLLSKFKASLPFGHGGYWCIQLAQNSAPELSTIG